MSDDNTPTPQDYTTQLQALLAGRMASGERLAAAAAGVRVAQDALDEASAAYAEAFAAATAAGWSERELRTVFKAVKVDPPVRPRRRRTRTNKVGPNGDAWTPPTTDSVRASTGADNAGEPASNDADNHGAYSA